MDTQKIITNHLMNDSDQELMRQVSLGGVVGERAKSALEYRDRKKMLWATFGILIFTFFSSMFLLIGLLK